MNVEGYLISGDDPYLVSMELTKILNQADPLNVDEFTSDDDLDAILQALSTPSMLGERRYVVVRRVDAMGAEGLRRITAQMEDLDPSIVFVGTCEKPPAKLAAAIRAVGHVVEVQRGKRRDVLDWIRSEASKRGMKISSDAATALVEAIGEERLALSNALEELSLAHPGRPLNGSLISSQFSGRSDAKVYSFLDATAGRQPGTALDLLNRLLAQGEAPQMILWSLVRQFRMMLMTVERSSGEVASLLGMPAWRAEKLTKQAREFTPDELANAYICLADADRKIKISEEPEVLAIERAVVAIAGERGFSKRRGS